MVKLLLKNGADVNAARKSGETALMIAASGGDLKIVKLLSDGGATLNNRTAGGKTALDMARKCGAVEVVRLLKGRKAK